MKVIQRGRMEGKTTELIREAARIVGSVIVVHNYRAIDMIIHYAREHNLTIETPITFEQILRGQTRGKIYTCFLIDNVDMVLQSLVGPIPIDTVTMTRHYNTRERYHQDTSED